MGFVVPHRNISRFGRVAEEVDVAGQALCGEEMLLVPGNVPALNPEGHFGGKCCFVMVEEILLQIFMRRLESRVAATRSGEVDYFMVGCMGDRRAERDFAPRAAEIRSFENMVRAVLEKSVEEGMKRLRRTTGPGLMQPVAVEPSVLEGDDPDSCGRCHPSKIQRRPPVDPLLPPRVSGKLRKLRRRALSDPSSGRAG